jgi:glyceraldehyde-3-phosphate dehydrogenase type II
MNILVNGMGNIGTTLVHFLLRYSNLFGIEKTYLYKRTLKPWNNAERDYLSSLGVILCSGENADNLPVLDDVIEEIDYIFEASANGVGLKNLDKYKQLKRLKGASAQGSEKGFGMSFMSGVNDQEICGEKFVNIVSCNTHGTASILRTITGNKLENLKRADVVVVRRSEDIGNHARLVSGNVVARHLSSITGTHHAIDVVDLYRSIGIDCNLTSSDITTPSQLMHSVRFHIELNAPLKDSEKFSELINANPYIAQTQKFDSNQIFEQGRRHGFQGRIYSHSIVVMGNLLETETSIKGWAFVPQEGNSILSTLHAFMLQMKLENTEAILKVIKDDHLRKEW